MTNQYFFQWFVCFSRRIFFFLFDAGNFEFIAWHKKNTHDFYNVCMINATRGKVPNFFFLAFGFKRLPHSISIWHAQTDQDLLLLEACEWENTYYNIRIDENNTKRHICVSDYCIYCPNFSVLLLMFFLHVFIVQSEFRCFLTLNST